MAQAPAQIHSAGNFAGLTSVKPEAAPASSQLRILIANESADRLHALTGLVIQLGHEVVAQDIDVRAALAGDGQLADLALVGLGDSPEEGLQLIGEIVHHATFPVIALLAGDDEQTAREAAKRGIFASVPGDSMAELRTAIEIALCRFADYHKLRLAFARRAILEQAKGILMSRNCMTADQAFASLREHSGRIGVKVVDVAASVIESHGLLLPSAAAKALDERAA